MKPMRKAENENGNLPQENAFVSDGRVYELGYLLTPALSPENVPARYGDLKDAIIGLGGKIISDEMPQMLHLAYTMVKIQNARNKFDTAYFGWIKFEMNPEKVLDLKKKLYLDPDLIRFLMLKTVGENTIAAKRFAHRDFRRRVPAAKKEEDEAVAINKEEIDKEIEALVAS